MRLQKIIAIGLFLFTFLHDSSYAQGELLAKKQSGGAFYYSTVPLERTRAHSISYTYISKRSFEFGITGFTIPSRFSNRSAERGLSAYGSAFLNFEGPVHLKGSLGATRYKGGVEPFYAASIFVNNSKGNSRVVPSVSVLTQYGEVAYGASLGLKLGNDFNLIGSIDLLKYEDRDLVVGFSVGFLLSDRKVE